MSLSDWNGCLLEQLRWIFVAFCFARWQDKNFNFNKKSYTLKQLESKNIVQELKVYKSTSAVEKEKEVTEGN